MRSGLVFNVSTRIPNRFLLCRMLAASARKMHRDGISTSQSINNSLVALRGSKESQEDMMNNVGTSGFGLNNDTPEAARAEALAVAAASLP
jgi:hypothetical protein